MKKFTTLFTSSMYLPVFIFEKNEYLPEFDININNYFILVNGALLVGCTSAMQIASSIYKEKF